MPHDTASTARTRAARAFTARAMAALALAGSLGLAGCAARAPGASSASVQDVETACAAVREKMAGAAERLTQLDVTDPQASAAAMSDVAASFADAGRAVDNPEIAALLPILQSDFAATATALGSVAAGDLSQLAALQAATGSIQDSFATFAGLCPPPSPAPSPAS